MKTIIVSALAYPFALSFILFALPPIAHQHAEGGNDGIPIATQDFVSIFVDSRGDRCQMNLHLLEENQRTDARDELIAGMDFASMSGMSFRGLQPSKTAESRDIPECTDK